MQTYNLHWFHGAYGAPFFFCSRRSSIVSAKAIYLMIEVHRYNNSVVGSLKKETIISISTNFSLHDLHWGK